MLNLVDHYDAAQTLESRYGLREARKTLGLLEVEVIGGAGGRDLPCQGSLAAPTRSDQCDGPAALEGASYSIQ